MTELLAWLSAHTLVAYLLLAVAVPLLVGGLVLLYVAGFQQGREVQFFPPRIGPRLVALSPPLPSSSRKLRLFVTTPLTGYDTEEKYAAFLARMDTVLRALRKLGRVSDAYYFNEEVRSLAEFATSKLSVPEYLSRIEQCDCFVLIAEAAFVSSVYFEAGFALARDKRCFYFVPAQKYLPTLMRRASDAYPQNVKTCEFSTLEEIPEVLREQLAYA